jgi:acetyltransferase-like isoleucine patch superfamily enzyme
MLNTSWISRVMRALLGPRMLYGYRHPSGVWLAHTRIGSTTELESPEGLDLGDHVFIGHHNFIDASGGLAIGEGTQITNYVSVLTHTSHRAARLMGRSYFGDPQPLGFVRQPTVIGPYCFIGAHSIIMPGSRLGRGVLVRAFSYVDGDFPDYAILGGQPARVIGDVREGDAAWIERHPQAAATYCGLGWPGR